MKSRTYVSSSLLVGPEGFIGGMIGVSGICPQRSGPGPPVIFIHGAANSSSVWKLWQQELAHAGWPSFAVDLRGHGQSRDAAPMAAGMEDYADDVRSVLALLRRPPVLVGWSMGGLVAMMVAASQPVAACIGIAPSTPALKVDPTRPLRTGQFGPEEYGITSLDPDDQPAMPDLDREEREIALASLGPESRLARDERKRGTVVERLLCPLLIVTGTNDSQWPRRAYDDLWLPADHLEIRDASHWGLVLNRRAVATAIPAVLNWIEEHTAAG